jgi:hypothetical protein
VFAECAEGFYLYTRIGKGIHLKHSQVLESFMVWLVTTAIFRRIMQINRVSALVSLRVSPVATVRLLRLLSILVTEFISPLRTERLPSSKISSLLCSDGILASHHRIIEQNTLKVSAKKFGRFASLDHRRLLFANHEQSGSGIFAKPLSPWKR